ncbi:MAG TPA: hypothetical protein PK129_07300, partial [Cellvibrionaceae bacterium]|nr:hypothetical protein [Cellvibrionaceae bacterium]
DYNYLIPKNFEQKRIKILEFLILKGGKEHREVDIKFETDFTLVYGDKDELSRVMSSLQKEDLVEVMASSKDGYGRVLPTKDGIKCAENVPDEISGLSNLFLEEEKAVIFSFIEHDEVKKAIEFIQSLVNTKGIARQRILVSLLFREFNTIQDNRIKGTINQEDEMVKMTKLSEKILLALEEPKTFP